MENYMIEMKETSLPWSFIRKQNIFKILANRLIKISDLNAKNDELNSLIETQKRIISILAHDLRNPLASIKNIIELKNSGVLDKKDWPEIMDMMASQLNTTIEMVENVVNWGQLHLKTGGLQFEDFNLHELVERIFNSELINGTVKNNNLINEIEPGAIIYSDPWVIEFILRNLISNANKFTENGSITVIMRQKGSKIILQVTDTGVGMTDKQVRELLNNNNYNSTLGTKKEKGSGLGLILVKEFIERINGTLTVASGVHKGTTFKIEI
jgi:signal transduction histidine kinase